MPTSTTCNETGIVHLQEGRLDEALAALEALLGDAHAAADERVDLHHVGGAEQHHLRRRRRPTRLTPPAQGRPARGAPSSPVNEGCERGV